MADFLDHHHHHHDHDDEGHVPLDPAQQSLADALRVSFGLLQVIMLALLVIYIASGYYHVAEQEKAVVLRFGEIVGKDSPETAVKGPGPYISWPFPINQVVKIQTAPQQINIDRAFWVQTTADEAGMSIDELAGARNRALNPELDGSLLTGDANIVHTKFSVIYEIEDPVNFIERVGDPSNPIKLRESAENLVRAVAERSIVHTIANLDAERVSRGLGADEADYAKRLMQEELGPLGLKSGIKVKLVSMKEAVFPFSVREAFQAAINAESEKRRAIEQAQQERNRTLGEVAGEAYEQVWQLVQAYERTRDPQQLAALDAQMDDVFLDLWIGKEDNRQAVGGQVAELINSAYTYRTSIVQKLRSEAESYESLLLAWKQNPRIVENRVWETAREQILSGKTVEVLYLPEGVRAYLELNRDPRVRKAIERSLLEQDEEERREAERARVSGAAR